MEVNKLEILDKVLKLKQLYDAGLIPRLTQHEVNPNLPKNDRLNYLYFTLPVSINFQRSSPAMWQSALKTFEDPETNYLFYPEKVVQRTREQIQADLIKHKLGLQRNKHTDIWIGISKTLHDFYEDHPIKVFESNDFDVIKILETIRKIRKKDFPYLSGTKMANYWLFILHKFTDVQFKNLNFISIIPDTHVIQCSIRLGLVPEKTNSEKVAESWRELLENSGVVPMDMHPVLWNWSRAKFSPEV